MFFPKYRSPSGIQSYSDESGSNSSFATRNGKRNPSSPDAITKKDLVPEPTGIIWPVYTKEEPKFMRLNPINVNDCSIWVSRGNLF